MTDSTISFIGFMLFMLMIAGLVFLIWRLFESFRKNSNENKEIIKCPCCNQEIEEEKLTEKDIEELKNKLEKLKKEWYKVKENKSQGDEK